MGFEELEEFVNSISLEKIVDELAVEELEEAVHDRFDEIVEWKSCGLTWEQIEGLLTGSGSVEPLRTLANRYIENHDRYRTAAKRLQLTSWVNRNYAVIAQCREMGMDWPLTIDLTAEIAGPPPVNRTPPIVREYLAIDPNERGPLHVAYTLAEDCSPLAIDIATRAQFRH